MSKYSSDSRASRIRVRVQPRQQVDLRRLARAVIELAMQEESAAGTDNQEPKRDEETAA